MIINTYVPERSVSDFYDGKSVFITGGTGFLGKVFIARLLMECPKINKIYLLVREKRGISVENRVTELIENPLFSRLREENPDVLKKIVPVSGDITAIDLDLSPSDEKELVEKVSIVFHVAASIKFIEPLHQALKVNVEGTINVFKLCERMENIKLLVHISTAYSNCREEIVEERLYPAPADLTDLYLQLKKINNDQDCTKLLNGWPNTYTFAKALAENFLAKHHGNVPTIIVRPSIVTAIYHSPLEGWLESWQGATGVLVPIAKGLNRVLVGDGKNVVDMIPADYVANLSIVAAAKNNKPKDVIFYNICSSARNPITLKQMVDLFVEDSIKKNDYIFPLTRFNFITKYKWLVSLVTVLFQILPAYMADTFRRLRGKQPVYVKLVYNLIKFRDTVEFFSSHSWIFKNDGVISLYNSLSVTDRERFPCDAVDINWPEYAAKYYDGVRLYVQRKKINFSS